MNLQADYMDDPISPISADPSRGTAGDNTTSTKGQPQATVSQNWWGKLLCMFRIHSPGMATEQPKPGSWRIFISCKRCGTELK